MIISKRFGSLLLRQPSLDENHERDTRGSYLCGRIFASFTELPIAFLVTLRSSVTQEKRETLTDLFCFIY